MTSPMHSPLQSTLQPVMRSPLDFRRRGGGFDPKSLFRNGEVGVWYDPSDLSTLFQDSAGTTPVTAVGQPVGLMLDKSGNGNHASQATAGNRPLLQVDANGKYYLVFDGVDDVLSAGASAEILPPREFWGAFNITTGGGIGTGLFYSGPQGSVVSSSSVGGLFQRSDGSFRQLLMATRIGAGVANNAIANSAFSIGVPFVARGTSTLSPGMVAIDSGGTPVTAAVTFSGTPGVANIANVGSSGCVFRFFGGLNINRPLTVGEAANLRAYFNGVCGI